MTVSHRFSLRTTLPGQIRQLGYVVHDIEQAMDHWIATMGVGPFFYFEKTRIDEFLFRGKPCSAMVSTAFANVRDVQIELIQQRNDAPSSYREFLDAGREGLQHIAFWTRTFDEDLDRAQQDGLTIMQSGFSGGDPEGRHVYFETEGHAGTILELSETVGVKGAFFDYVAETSKTWDGRDPIRAMS